LWFTVTVCAYHLDFPKMNTKYFSLFVLVALIASYSCNPAYKFRDLSYPTPVATDDQPISLQEKKLYEIDGIQLSNQFDGARANDFTKINDSTYRVTVLPENEPINESPHYAFWLSSSEERDIDLEIYTGNYKHRYWPKLSLSKKSYVPIDSSKFDTLKAGNIATLKLNLDGKKLYVAAQELRPSGYTKTWIQQLKSKHPFIKTSTIGQSKLGRDIAYLDLGEGNTQKKPAILIFSRTHPPEITGYMAMEHYVTEILADTPLSNSFRKKYRIMVYPLINPDGVDLGHWRHNAGGVDLNRDWSTFQQEETRAVAQHAIASVKENKNEVVLGMDFHSTQEDVIYTHTDNRQSSIYPYKDLWIQALEDDAIGLHPNEEAYDLGKPMTKGWFYLQFGAEGIIYEVGDDTDRDFLKYKAEVAAREMMKLLVFRADSN